MSIFQDTFEDWLMADTPLTYDEWLTAGNYPFALDRCLVKNCRATAIGEPYDALWCAHHQPPKFS